MVISDGTWHELGIAWHEVVGRIVGVRGYAVHAEWFLVETAQSTISQRIRLLVKELVNENMIDCKKEPEISHIIQPLR